MEIRTRQDADLVLEAAARVYRKRARIPLDNPDAILGTAVTVRMVEGFFATPLHEEAPDDLLREIAALKGESG